MATMIMVISIVFLNIGFWGTTYYLRKSILENNDLRKQISQEKEKLRLLNLMHPEKRYEQGWTYVYEPEIKFISKYHENGKGKQSICAIRGWNVYNDDSDYYGYLIANLLNDKG